MRDAEIPAGSGATAPATARPYDILSILSHPTLRLAKRWEADGSITPYGDAKYYSLIEKRVEGIGQLSCLLKALEVDAYTCLIRGRYVGVEEAQRRDPEYKDGRVRRALAQFEEQPLHTMLVDIDRFEPLSCDPLLMPELAIEEFICSALPREFWGRAYHWQLSSSMGSYATAGVLKAHVWFWLEQPLTGTELRDWAVVGNGSEAWPVDVAVFRTVQPHYTAAPVFAEGVTDPVPVRSGFVDGLVGDHVPLLVGPGEREAIGARADAVRHARAGAGGAGGEGGGWARHQVVREILDRDSVAQKLAELGLVKSQAADGALNIECPFAELHSTKDTETTTQYFPAHTRGYAKGNFRCMHASCEGRARGVWLARLGLLDEAVEASAAQFAVVSEPVDNPVDKGAGGAGNGAVDNSVVRSIPEAKHLCTDQANAERIIRQFGGQMFVAGGRWYAWDGRRWVRQDTDSEAYRNAFNLSALVHAEAASWRARVGLDVAANGKAEEIAKALDKWAAKCEMNSHLTAAVKLVHKALEVDVERLDRDPWLLNCRNGVVDLRTGVLRPHRPEDYITKLVDVDYRDWRAGARSLLWEQTLDRIMLEEGVGGVGEGPLVSFLRRWFGYCCTALTREQVFVVHWGSGGNGKSTVLDVIADVLGDYAGTAAPGLLAGGKGDRHPTEVAALWGRRMVTAHETGDGAVLREDFVKQATGGDRMPARFMREDFFEFTPTHKIQLLTNHKPAVRGTDPGIWRRVLLLPYVARFGSREDVAAGRAHFAKDLTLAEKLKAAGEREGVLAWLVRGAVEWAAEGLRAPDAVLAASRDYQGEQDRVGQFVRECCELGVEHCAPLSSPMGGGLYPEYQGWCHESGIVALSKRRFLTELERVIPGMETREGKVADGATRRKILQIKGVRLLQE